MTVAAGFLVSFFVIFFSAMLQLSSSSNSLFSVLSTVILGAVGGSDVLVLFWFVLVFLRRHCRRCPGCRRLTWVYMFLSRWCSLSLLPPPMRLCVGREGKVYIPQKF